jgi:hypothetical protein
VEGSHDRSGEEQSSESAGARSGLRVPDSAGFWFHSDSDGLRVVTDGSRVEVSIKRMRVAAVEGIMGCDFWWAPEVELPDRRSRFRCAAAGPPSCQCGESRDFWEPPRIGGSGRGLACRSRLGLRKPAAAFGCWQPCCRRVCL